MLLTALGLVMPLDVALLGTLFWRFTPEIWEVSTYAHPWTFAFPLFLAGVLIAAGRLPRWAARLSATALFFVAFSMRADTVLLVPVVVGTAFLGRRELVKETLISSVAAASLFLAVQAIVTGSQLVYLLGDSPGLTFDPRQWAVNLAFYAYGAGCVSLTVLAAGGLRLVKTRSARIGVLVATAALLPTLVLWIPHGGAARHFAPVYLAIAACLAYTLAVACREPLLRLAIVIGVIAGNAIVAEAIYQADGSGHFHTVQPGGDRRVIERVPLGNVWSNHQAKARMNVIENTYGDWALRCSTSGASNFAQEAPYRLLMLASIKYGAPSVSSLNVYRFGEHLSVADIPEAGSPAWWSEVQYDGPASGTVPTLLGPRIPGWLLNEWQEQYARSRQPGMNPQSIADRPCASGAQPVRFARVS